jgi:protocatechuate 3,4-dioxygenase beta subunit
MAILVAACAAAAASSVEASPTSQPASAPAADANVAARIGRLIGQLSAERYPDREAAHKELVRLGAAAVGALQAVDPNGDPERAVRIREVLRQIEAAAAEQAWLNAASALPRDFPPSQFPGGARLAGRVLDANGKPLPDALVTLRSSSMGEDLLRAFAPQARTDANGRVEFAVPFDDILYEVQGGRMGYYFVRVPCAVRRAGGPADIVLGQRRDTRVMRGSVSAGGKPVPGVEARFINEYGQEASARTDREGKFVWEGLPVAYPGQGVALIRSGDLVAPLQVIGGREERLDFVLEKPAELEGAVREEKGGKPVPGATVIIEPVFRCGLRLEATTDGNGRYRLRGIPPGAYWVTASAPGHFYGLPRDHGTAEAALLIGGETTTRDIEMTRMAVVQGRVLNHGAQPVPGALVSILSARRADDRYDQYRYVETDRDGRFTIATGHMGDKQGLTLSAFSSREGLAQKQTGPLELGKVYSDISLRLPGAAYVRGTVTDPNGRPIPGVVCVIDSRCTVSVETGEDGRFDLGRVTLDPPESNRRTPILFRAPRPHRGAAYDRAYPFDSKYVVLESRSKAPQFYLNAQVPLEARPGQELDLKVVLKPAQLLELSGVVVDAVEAPVAEATVTLFTGDADANEWLAGLLRGPVDWRMPQPPVRNTNIAVARTRTDANGCWRIWAVREDGVACPMGGPQADWKRFCVGAGDGILSTFVQDVVVPEDNPRRELRLKLAPTAAPAAGAP